MKPAPVLGAACIAVAVAAYTPASEDGVATSRPPSSISPTSTEAGSTTPVSTVPVVTTTSTSSPPWTPPEHPIHIEDGRFVDTRTGEPPVVRGTNYLTRVRVGGGYQDRTFSPSVFDPERVAADFAALADRGYNTVRIFLDSCNGGPGRIAKVGGERLDGEYLDVIVQVMDLARSHGLFLLLTSNDLPDGGGYARRSSRDDAGVFPGYRNSIYPTGAVVSYATFDAVDLTGAAVDGVDLDGLNVADSSLCPDGLPPDPPGSGRCSR